MLLFNPIIDFSMYLNPGERIKWMYNIEGIININPCYYITSKGRIFSLSHRHHNTPYEMATGSQHGYCTIKLSSPTGIPQSLRIDRLVLYYFGGPIPSNVRELEANHIDGNTLNDDISNLEWVTHQENMNHAGRMGLMGNSLTREIANNIIDDLLSGKYNILEIAERNNTSESVVQNIKYNKTYKEIRPEERKNLVRSKTLTSSDIISIYKESLIKIDDERLAKKYNVSKKTIGAIRRVQYPYDGTLINAVPILEDRIKCDDETALKIYTDCKDSHLTIGQIAAKYGVGKSIVNDIKFLRHSYEPLREKYNIEPLENTKGIRKALTPEQLLGIKNFISHGVLISNIAKMYNISEATIYKIKRGEYNNELE